MATKKSARIDELARTIKYHQDLYYNSQPEISDADFDELWDELKRLDPAHEIFRTVGSDGLDKSVASTDRWPKAKHLMLMGSQEKAANPEEFFAWARKVQHPEYIAQYKLDGASLELQYADGILQKAVTRGDGEIGDDITPNAKKMQGVIEQLTQPFTGGIRGEVVMPHAVHKKKYSDKANCRNAANGLMKRKDGIGSEDLEVICYDALASSGTAPFHTELEKVEWLKKMKFITTSYTVCKSPEDVVTHREQVAQLRSKLDYDIDGLVIKGNEIDAQDMLRTRPEKQIAFKFTLEEVHTELLAVEWSETGASFTPIGVVSPVQLMGTTVQRANLNNTNMIRELGIKIGSIVGITKRGEIIPKIERLISTPAGAKEIAIPSQCSCGSALVDEGTRLYCPNPSCIKKLQHRIEKWIAVLDISDFGSVILTKLIESGRVKKIADLYTLTVDELKNFERMGETLSTKILRNLNEKKSIRLSQFIAGLDIEGIGETIAEKIVLAGIDTIEKWQSASSLELGMVDGVSEITANTIIEGLNNLHTEISALLKPGCVTIQARNSTGKFVSLSFCFTGELHSMKRADAEAIVKELGGSAKSSVTKGLSYLVTNDKESGSDKNKKAQSFGIPIINEEEFLKLAKG